MKEFLMDIPIPAHFRMLILKKLNEDVLVKSISNSGRLMNLVQFLNVILNEMMYSKLLMQKETESFMSAEMFHSVSILAG